MISIIKKNVLTTQFSKCLHWIHSGITLKLPDMLIHIPLKFLKKKSQSIHQEFYIQSKNYNKCKLNSQGKKMNILRQNKKN